MGYVGNQTTTAFTSMDKQDITGNGGASYTLSHAVANAQEIEVFVNNVRQEPAVAYTVSGTALSMTGNVASTDDFYVVYQGKAVQTVVPPDGSVTSAKLDTNIAIAGTLSTVGSVGIGLSSGIDGKLHVAGNTVVGDSSTTAFSSFTSGGLDVAVGSGTKAFQVWDDNSTSTPRFIVERGGNVGIGVAPSELLHIKNASGDAAVRIQGNTRTFNIQQNNYGLRFVDVDAGSAERMRLDASGNLLVGRTSSLYGTEKLHVYNTTNVASFWCDTGSDLGAFFIRHERASGGTTAEMVAFKASGGGTVGSIRSSGSSTSYNTSSDYRLKESVTYDWDATTRLKQLKPARFEWIADGDDAVPVDGFLAHEVQDIVPEAIVGEKDGMRDEEYEVTPAVEATYDDEGNVLTEAVPAVMGTRSVPDYQGIDQSKIVPLLVKTIIELEARITALEAS